MEFNIEVKNNSLLYKKSCDHPSVLFSSQKLKVTVGAECNRNNIQSNDSLYVGSKGSVRTGIFFYCKSCNNTVMVDCSLSKLHWFK